MRLYGYDPDTAEVLVVVHGQDHRECERKAAVYGDGSEIGWTYSPAWGTVDELHLSPDTEWID